MKLNIHNHILVIGPSEEIKSELIKINKYNSNEIANFRSYRIDDNYHCLQQLDQIMI